MSPEMMPSTNTL